MKFKTKTLNILRIICKINFVEQLLCKYTQGKSLDSLIARIPANYYQYSYPSIRKVQRGGIWFELDISDYMEWLIYFGIIVEPRKKLYDLSHNATVVIDIGANIGETTLNFAKRTNKTGFVYSFEPDQKCFNKLKHNIELNNFSNIKVYNFGLGDIDANYFLASDEVNNKGGNKIHLKSHEEHNIVVKKFDNVITELNLQQINLIKIDVEGFEYRILKGAEESIIKYRPILFIELDDNNLSAQESSAKDLILFLEKFYSKIEHASTGKAINSKMSFTNCHFDIIAYK